MKTETRLDETAPSDDHKTYTRILLLGFLQAIQTQPDFGGDCDLQFSTTPNGEIEIFVIDGTSRITATFTEQGEILFTRKDTDKAPRLIYRTWLEEPSDMRTPLSASPQEIARAICDHIRIRMWLEEHKNDFEKRS